MTEVFEGCLVVVSHDNFFVNRVAEHLFVFEGDGVVRDFEGIVSSYPLFSSLLPSSPSFFSFLLPSSPPLFISLLLHLLPSSPPFIFLPSWEQHFPLPSSLPLSSCFSCTFCTCSHLPSSDVIVKDHIQIIWNTEVTLQRIRKKKLL